MATWAETDPQVLQKYGRTVTAKTVELNWWNKFMNNDEGAVIMTDLRTESPNEEGGTVREKVLQEIKTLKIISEVKVLYTKMLIMESSVNR
jgi:hypothetical protein